MSDQHSINSRQLMVYIMSGQIGIGITTLAAHLAKDLGHDGWVSILLAGLVTTIFLILIMLLMKRYGDKSIFEINRLLFGKYPGMFINFILALYLTFDTCILLRAFTDFTNLLILPLTSPVLLSCLLILPTLYLSWYGLKPVCRFSYVLFLSIAIILALALLVHDEMRLSFLMPVGETGIISLIKEMPTSFYSLLGFELFVFIYPHITDKNKAMKWGIAASLSTMTFYTFVFIISVGLLGENLLKTLAVPLFDLSRFYRKISFERLDVFFVLLWLPFLESSLRIYFFTAYYSFNKLFTFRNKGLFTLIFVVLLVLLSRIPKDSVQLSEISKIDSIIGVSVVGFFILCYLFSFINKRGMKET